MATCSHLRRALDALIEIQTEVKVVRRAAIARGDTDLAALADLCLTTYATPTQWERMLDAVNRSRGQA